MFNLLIRARFITMAIVLSLILSQSFATPLVGPYTIDASLPTAGTNFHSFTDFAASLNINGVTGPVVATVVAGSGPYNEQVDFINIPGANYWSSVTIDGQGESITSLTTSNNPYALRLNHCQYFNINNLVINRDPASTGKFYGIHFLGTGEYITISNCTVDMTNTTDPLSGAFIASGSATNILYPGEFHDITINSNMADGGGYGASVYGLMVTMSTYHISITNNSFFNYHSNGVYLSNTDSSVVAHNFFDKISNTIANCNAIQLGQGADDHVQVYNNDIRVSQTNNGNMTQAGILIADAYGIGHKIYNNVIHNIQLSSGHYIAIEIASSGGEAEIFHNTVSLDNPFSTTGNLYGIMEGFSNSMSILRDNMISINQSTSGNKTGLVLGSISILNIAFNSNYNNIWVPGGNVAQKGASLFYPTLSDWQLASQQDSNSSASDPVFFNFNYQQPTSSAVDNTGIAIPWISQDITGVVRSDPPDMGAYEFTALAPATPDTLFGDTLICEYSSGVVFYVNPVPGATSYFWTVSGATLVSGQGTNIITVDFTNITSTVSVIAVNNIGNSNPISLVLLMIPNPVVNLSLQVDSVCQNWLTIPLSGGMPLLGTYSGTGVYNNLFHPVLVGTGYHAITYTFEASNGCAAQATDSVFVDLCTMIPENSAQSQVLAVYPNPCSEECTVFIPINNSSSDVYIYDVSGLLVQNFKTNSQSFHLHSADFPAGLYFIRVITPAGLQFVSKVQF